MRWIGALLTVALLAGCGGDDSSPTAPPRQESTPTTDPGSTGSDDGPPTDAADPDAIRAALNPADRAFCAALDELAFHPDPTSLSVDDIEALAARLREHAPDHLRDATEVWAEHMVSVSMAFAPYAGGNATDEDIESVMNSLAAEDIEFVEHLASASATGLPSADRVVGPVIYHAGLVCTGEFAPDDVPDWWLVRLLLPDGRADQLPLSLEEAVCLAEELATAWGPERLATMGLTEAEDFDDLGLTPDEEDAALEMFSDCIDLTPRIVDMLMAEQGTPRAAARCAADRLMASGLVEESLRAEELDPELNQRIDDFLDDAVAACS
jgi:hypothetical protein